MSPYILIKIAPRTELGQQRKEVYVTEIEEDGVLGQEFFTRQ